MSESAVVQKGKTHRRHFHTQGPIFSLLQVWNFSAAVSPVLSYTLSCSGTLSDMRFATNRVSAQRVHRESAHRITKIACNYLPNRCLIALGPLAYHRALTIPCAAQPQRVLALVLIPETRNKSQFVAHSRELPRGIRRIDISIEPNNFILQTHLRSSNCSSVGSAQNTCGVGLRGR